MNDVHAEADGGWVWSLSIIFFFQDNTRPNFENNSVIEAVDDLLKTDFS